MDENRESGSGRSPLPRCELCGELIGVYEPLVPGTRAARVTSIAAEPELLDSDLVYRHVTCAGEARA